MKAFKKIMDGIAFLEEIVMAVGLSIVSLITFANVVVRKCSNFQFAWSEELVVNLFVLLIMLGCALCIREGSMISLSLVYDRLSFRAKKFVTVLITIFNLLFWGVLFKTGADKVLSQMASGKQTFSLGWREWVFTIYLPIGCALLILHNIEFFIDEMMKKPEGAEAEGGND